MAIEQLVRADDQAGPARTDPYEDEGCRIKDALGGMVSSAPLSVCHLANGCGTALPAPIVPGRPALTAVACLVGVGLPMAPAAPRAVHATAGVERARLGCRGFEVVAPKPPPTQLRLALADATTRREPGHGGADEHNGTGLIGIRRRIAVHDGALHPKSPRGGPTILEEDLPCGS